MVVFWEGGVAPTDAPETEAMHRYWERKAGRTAAKRREVVRRDAIVEEWRVMLFGCSASTSW
jgi:hypothetical protein